MEPSHQGKVGERRSTQNGTLLKGTYAESFWMHKPFNRDDYSSTDDRIEDTLEGILKCFEPKADFIQKLNQDGGRALIWVSSYSGRNYAFELSPETLGRLSQIGFSFAHDVYPCAQNW